MIWVLCFGEFETNFVFLCRFHPITDKHKEDELQIENGRPIWVYEYLLGTLASWVFQLLDWVLSGCARIGETKLNIYLKEYQGIWQKLWEFEFFCLVCSQNTTNSVFLHLERIYLLLATLKVFFRSKFILFANVSCQLSERGMMVSSAKWYILWNGDTSGDHWCTWRIMMDLGQILEALLILFLWLLMLGYQWIHTAVFTLVMKWTSD